MLHHYFSMALLLPLLLIVSMPSISSSSTIQPDCGYCSKPHPHPRSHPPTVKPPITLPPLVPVLPVPPITLPNVPLLPPVTVPNVPVVPPVTVPTVPILPPVLNPPKGKACPPGTPSGKGGGATTCPIDTLKLGACVDLLGGLVHVGLGDPAVNECCPVISGLAELEAAVCLCMTLKIRALNLNVYVPLALQLLVTCGKTPPPGYTCSL